MLLSLLPTTALAADYDAVGVNDKILKNGYYLESNGSTDVGTGATTTAPETYVAWYKDGVLTLKGYNGKGIETQGVAAGELTVKLIGSNSINNGALESDNGGDITVTSDSSGTLSISKTTIGSNPAIGIETGLSSSYTTGNVTIKGNAKVTINMTHNGTSTYEKAYGIFAKENITISENASVDITCATSNNTTGGGNCNGLYAKKNVTIDTNGTIKIDVTNAGKDKDNGYSYGVYLIETATLTKVGNMEVQWKKEGNSTRYSGGAFNKGATFSDTDHAINVDTTNCYASYRYSTSYYTVMVQNGTLTGTGVKYANGNGNFLENDTVNIKPNEKKSYDDMPIPFKKWTAKGVTLSSPAMSNTSFNVPTNPVTVTATYNPFVGTPVFTRTDDASGTISFETTAKANAAQERFALVKVGDEGNLDSSETMIISTTSTSSPYAYSDTVSSSNVPAGDYYVAEKLNGDYYLSDKFAVNYTASAANISLDKTDTVDFGSKEAGYSTAPAEQTVNITNSGTADTGTLTIALDGANKNDFTLSKTSISNIAANGTDTFTVQPITGLTAGIYNTTVKVSGTGVTEQSFNVKFTVTTPLTAIAVPAANTGHVYDGTEKTGVSAGMGYTLGGTYEATDVGATDYAATATLNTGYKWTDGSTDVKTIKWNIGKRTPTVADFTFAPPTNLTYDGSDKTASVTPKSPFTKSGAINVKYEKSGTAVTETKDVGKYTVKIDVAGGENFTAGSDLNDPAWTFSIILAEWGTPTEALASVNPTTVGGSEDKITGTTTAMQYKKSTDSSWTNCSSDVTGLAAGTYYVRYKADGNHTASDTYYRTFTLTDPGATLYSVTVTDGAAEPTGDQAASTEVTITATTKTGFNFKEWTGLADGIYKSGSTKASNPATFIMPASAVNVTATYEAAALTGTASITGDLKYGKELTATLTGGTNNTGTLTYKWYRSGKTDAIATNTTGKYTLVAADIDKTITVKITSSVQTGEITSPETGKIDKADGPAEPSVTPVACTNSSNNDGKITGVNTTMEYSVVSDFATKTTCTGSDITGLANGTYYVRVEETTTHKAGTPATVIVPAYTAFGTSGGTSSGGSSGGGYVPTTQKPDIKAGEGGSIVLSKDGTTATITPNAGMMIDKVMLNGKDMGALTVVKGIKTGDKLEVSFKQTAEEKAKMDKAVVEQVAKAGLTARSARTAKKNVKLVVKSDLEGITDAGYTVEYKFYRSTKKSAGYKAMKTGKSGIYINTYGKKGTLYYYKVKVMVYDKDGNLTAQSALKQCKYASRLWTK